MHWEDLMLQVRLLGQFDIRMDGKRVTTFHHGRVNPYWLI